MRRSFLFIMSLVFLSGCQNPPPAEESCNFSQNSFNRRVSWARLPIQLYVDESLLTIDVGDNDRFAAFYALREAVEFWNQQFETPVFELDSVIAQLPTPELTTGGKVVPDGYNGIYVVSPDVFQNTNGTDEQARASISFRGDYIYEADIIIDGSERFYFEDETRAASSGQVQFKSLMIHELGHALGLAHVDIPGTDSVMYPRLSYGQMRPVPVEDSNGVAARDASGNTILELPEIDAESVSCEYDVL